MVRNAEHSSLEFQAKGVAALPQTELGFLYETHEDVAHFFCYSLVEKNILLIRSILLLAHC